MGRPNHHTTRIDANPPRYRTCDSHRIRLAQRLLNPSRAFSSTSPLQSSIKLAFSGRYELGGLSFAYHMYRLGFVPASCSCERVRVGRPTTTPHKLKRRRLQAGSDSLLFSLGLDIDRESIDPSSSLTSLTNIRIQFHFTAQPKKKDFSAGWPSSADECLLSLKSTTNKWERQDSNLRRKTSTDLQSVAFDHSATLPFPGRGPPQWVLRKRDKNLK